MLKSLRSAARPPALESQLLCFLAVPLWVGDSDARGLSFLICNTEGDTSTDRYQRAVMRIKEVVCFKIKFLGSQFLNVLPSSPLSLPLLGAEGGRGLLPTSPAPRPRQIQAAPCSRAHLSGARLPLG